jgi:uncharacterized delta-60 repeat protein
VRRNLVAWALLVAASAASFQCGSDSDSPGDPSDAGETNDGAPGDGGALSDATSAGDGALGDGSATDASGDARTDANGVDGGPDGSALAGLDPGFGAGGILTSAVRYGNDDVRGMARQADGKILTIGRNYAHDDTLLFRFTTTGALDTTFNGTGAVLLPLDLGFGYGVAVQSDGHIVTISAAGSSSRGTVVHRFTSSGALDTSFGTGGVVTLSDQPGGLVIQPDDKIVVATGTYVPYVPVTVTRLSSTGTLDTAFGSNGRVQAWTGNVDAVSKGVALDSQGRIVALADISSTLAVARFTSAGALDTTFGGTGTVTLNLSDQSGAWSRPFTVQPDDKILVGGRGIAAPVAFTAVIARLDAAGALDTSFDSDGYVPTPVGNNYAGVAVDSSSRVVVLRTGFGSDTFSRFTASGAIDSTFGTSGVFTTSVEQGATSLLVQADDKLVSGSFVARGTRGADVVVVRTNLDGTLDATWGTAGVAKSNANDSFDQVRAIAPTANGFFAAGYACEQSTLGESFAVTKHTANGALDTSFGNGGTAVLDADSAVATGVAVDSMGRIVVGGGQTFTAGRFTANGTPDTTFNGVGWRSVNVLSGSAYNAAFAMALDASDRPVLGGMSSTAAGRFAVLARLQTNGANDTTFGNNGVVQSAADTTYSAVLGLAIQSDGKIVATGGRSSNGSRGIYLARFAADGTPDPAFTATTSAHDLVIARAVSLQSDGKILVAGYELPAYYTYSVYDFGRYGLLTNSHMIVRRYDASGAIDASFATSGTFASDLSSAGCASPAAYALTAIPSGGAYVAGICTAAGGRRGFVVRLLANGALDTSFGTSGVYSASLGIAGANAGGGLYALAFQPDGKLLAGGVGYMNPTGNDFALLRFK